MPIPVKVSTCSSRTFPVVPVEGFHFDRSEATQAFKLSFGTLCTFRQR